MISNDLDAEIKDACCHSTDTFTWGEWVEGFATRGIKIVEDESGYMETKILTSAQAEEALRLCKLEYDPIEIVGDVDITIQAHQESASVEKSKVEHVKPASRKLTVGEWRLEYRRVSETPPVGEFVTAERGNIRLEIEYNPGKPPFIYTRLSLSGVVGEQPRWCAQGLDQTNTHGWKVVILPKARDAVIKKYGVERDFIEVKMLRIIKMSDSKLSLLAEISEW